MINWEEYRQHLQDEAEERRRREEEKKKNQQIRDMQKMSTFTSLSQKEYQKKYYKNHKSEIYEKQKDYHSNYQKAHAGEIYEKRKKQRYEMKPVRYVVRKDGEAYHCKTLNEVVGIINAKKSAILTGFRKNKGVYVANGYEIVDLESDVINESKLWPTNLSWEIYGECVVIQNLDKFMEVLTDREKDVLLERYKYHKTLEDIGKIYDITRERVRQIERTAVRKLQKKEGII